MSALVSVSVPRNIPIETSSSRCHLEIKARGVVFVILVCGLKHQNMPSAILYSFSYGGHFFTAVSFMICQCLESWFVFRQAILMEAQVSLGFPYEDRIWGACTAAAMLCGVRGVRWLPADCVTTPPCQVVTPSRQLPAWDTMCSCYSSWIILHTSHLCLWLLLFF